MILFSEENCKGYFMRRNFCEFCKIRLNSRKFMHAKTFYKAHSRKFMFAKKAIFSQFAEVLEIFIPNRVKDCD